ncbi:uncharacterized protein LOC115874878 [Sitophilus oryzae]|uniref:Uncharacterized protein LOC115874878 n=1 Tax=Sitophilus oryzae TaxID=7048 RepID=A0A6J2X524_SITOR|nr:uncharacterized protein LOC115874878 [Sitophilus oryzae]
MPIKYIGKKYDFRGKTIWEIVGNLKNFGVGRIITRGRFERYPEPSFIKILKVETLPKPENESLDNFRKVRVLVEKTFRGKKHPKPILMESTTYKPDYKLIPKDEEENFCKNIEKTETATRILPRTMEFPPLIKKLIIKEHSALGTTPKKEDLELPIAYNKISKNLKYKIAKEGEEPTEKISLGLGKPYADRLYKGIDL